MRAQSHLCLGKVVYSISGRFSDCCIRLVGLIWKKARGSERGGARRGEAKKLDSMIKVTLSTLL